MSATVTIDTTRFNQQMAGVYDALVGAGRLGDAATLVADESRLFLKEIINKTPPKSLAQGRKAVRRDIFRSMTPFAGEQITKPELRKRWGEIERNDPGKYSSDELQGILRDFGWKKVHLKAFDTKLHTGQRDSRGRVQTFKDVFVLEKKQLMKYINQVQSRVGYMKSGWVPAYKLVGGVVKDWISRHRRPAGFTIGNLSGEKPSIVIGNYTRGISQVRHAVESALRTRTVSMGRKIKLIISGYSADVKAGMRPRRRATVTPASKYAGE